jgi:hypothetical protein
VLTHALEAGSPANNSTFEDCVATDSRGVPRPQVNCATANFNRQDLGAYEFVKCATKVVNVVGTNGADTLRGSNLGDGILALGGNDKVLARNGNDKACGGDGSDILKGEDDKDTLLGQAGNDTLNGGPASDKCVGGPGSDSATACETTRSL